MVLPLVLPPPLPAPSPALPAARPRRCADASAAELPTGLFSSHDSSPRPRLPSSYSSPMPPLPLSGSGSLSWDARRNLPGKRSTRLASAMYLREETKQDTRDQDKERAMEKGVYVCERGSERGKGEKRREGTSAMNQQDKRARGTEDGREGE